MQSFKHEIERIQSSRKIPPGFNFANVSDALIIIKWPITIPNIIHRTIHLQIYNITYD